MGVVWLAFGGDGGGRWSVPVVVVDAEFGEGLFAELESFFAQLGIAGGLLEVGDCFAQLFGVT